MLFARHYGSMGPTVVLLHGGPGAAGDMAPVARRLSRTYRVVEPFQRPSGAEPLTVAQHIADLHETVTACSAGARPALLGSSWGAMLALAYAAAHPEASGPLILVGSGTFDAAARGEMNRRMAEGTDAPMRALLAEANCIADADARARAKIEAIAPLYVVDPIAAPEEEWTIDARSQEETWSDMLRLQAEGVYPAAFAAIEVPVLMVHGALDPHPGRLIRDSLAPFLPQLDYRELAACGHYPWLERKASEDFYRLVTAWLDAQAPAPPS